MHPFILNHGTNPPPPDERPSSAPVLEDAPRTAAHVGEARAGPVPQLLRCAKASSFSSSSTHPHLELRCTRDAHDDAFRGWRPPPRFQQQPGRPPHRRRSRRPLPAAPSSPPPPGRRRLDLLGQSSHGAPKLDSTKLDVDLDVSATRCPQRGRPETQVRPRPARARRPGAGRGLPPPPRLPPSVLGRPRPAPTRRAGGTRRRPPRMHPQFFAETLVGAGRRAGHGGVRPPPGARRNRRPPLAWPWPSPRGGRGHSSA